MHSFGLFSITAYLFSDVLRTRRPDLQINIYRFSSNFWRLWWCLKIMIELMIHRIFESLELRGRGGKKRTLVTQFSKQRRTSEFFSLKMSRFLFKLYSYILHSFVTLSLRDFVQLVHNLNQTVLFSAQFPILFIQTSRDSDNYSIDFPLFSKIFSLYRAHLLSGYHCSITWNRRNFPMEKVTNKERWEDSPFCDF